MKENVAERFIRTIQSEIYEDMTSISKNVYIDELDHIVTECNNTCHSTIKMNSADVKSSTCIGLGVENNKKDPKFEAGEHVRIS